MQLRIFGLRDSYLLLPALELIDEEIIPLSDLGKLAIHSTLEVDEILPCFHCISRVLIAFSDNFVKMAHGHLGHQWLLDRATEDSFHACVTALQSSISVSSFPFNRLLNLQASRRHGP